LTADLSIVVPTLNESRNVPQLVALLDRVLAGIAWEAIFVDDDSTDGTWRVAKEIARRDPRVRCIRRVDRRGLAGACIEGALSSAASYIAIMDADLQHDESRLPAMFGVLSRDEADVVVASRYTAGGNCSGLPGLRAPASTIASRLAGLVIGRDVTDPMSGFFMVRRELFEKAACSLVPSGFKILFDLLACLDRSARVREVAYRFKVREMGQSKFDARAVLDFLALLLHRWTRGIVPLRFLFFACVGAIGVGVHLASLKAGLVLAGLSFEWAQIAATVVAMTSNFFANNALTYRDMQLRGRAVLGGLLRFYAVCTVGAVANVGVASFLFQKDGVWWLAGLAGIIVGTAFNYTMSSIFVWTRRF
jgi:dolichol-phosphate mannosyltransferase